MATAASTAICGSGSSSGSLRCGIQASSSGSCSAAAHRASRTTSFLTLLALFSGAFRLATSTSLMIRFNKALVYDHLPIVAKTPELQRFPFLRRGGHPCLHFQNHLVVRGRLL